MFNFSLSLSSKGISRDSKTYFNIKKVIKKYNVELKSYKSDSYYYFMALVNITGENSNITLSVMGFTFYMEVVKTS